MEAILSLLFPPQLPTLEEREALTGQHLHVTFFDVPESGTGEVRERVYRDAIERVHAEQEMESIT